MTTVVDGSGYLRFPTISGDTVVFVSEDDLWSVPVGGGRAWRLTAGVAETTHPRLSPGGEWVAFVGREEGPAEVYVMPATGGTAHRLTYHGADTAVVGWHDQQIVYTTNAGRPFRRDSRLYRIAPTGGSPRPLGYGPAATISWASSGSSGVVLGRSSSDPARWKRYRGGTAGTIWVDPDGTGEFEPLVELDGNVVNPCWVGERIYFLSDHEGVGNLYSTTPHGKQLQRHTDHDQYYARNLSGDGTRLVYHCAAEVYVLEPDAEHPTRIPVHTTSSRTQRNRRFVSAADYLGQADLGPTGSDLAITARGKAFSFAHWEGSVRQHGEPDGVRYRLLRWLADHRRLVASAGDERESEHLVVLTADGSEPARWWDQADVGRPVELVCSPYGAEVALTNHRNELLLVDLNSADGDGVRVLDHSPDGRVTGVTWAPDGRWLAYARPESPQTQAIMLCAVESGQTWRVAKPVLRDRCPAFDPDGRYLYFLGERELDPVYDTVQFELSFPLGTRPYAVALRADVGSPFVPEPQPVANGAAKRDANVDASTADGQKPDTEETRSDAESGDGQPSTGDQPTPMEIDVDGLDQRIVAFPVPQRRYSRMAGLSGKVLLAYNPIEGALSYSPLSTEPPATAVLEVYDFAKQKSEQLVESITEFTLDRAHTTLLYRSGNRLRVLPAGEKPAEQSDDPGRRSGWIDLSRVKVSVRPGAEWRQMFREAWRLQRDQYWSQDMAGVEWAAIYDRYLPLVDRVATRSELSDLLWEFQGELGTSHAYELGGEYRPGPQYRQGYLGADLDYDAEVDRYRVTHILRGDVWDAAATSPLNRPGVDIRVGDEIATINGQTLGHGPDGVGLDGAGLNGAGLNGAGLNGAGYLSPAEALVNQAEQEVALTIVRGEGEPRTVNVRALADERQARYRDWVEAIRAIVSDRTEGRVGYVHIPNMLAPGFAEFHRSFLTEFDREALIVDVRFNGGGHVSGLLLEKLARRRLGYVYPRWAAPRSHPMEAPRGPLVALANEHSGSDGDIFSHSFKQLGLGTLVGKRTWGGVIGIAPRQALADGTVTTQPEYSFGFDDVGWRVENYGTDPDIEVDVAPQDYARGVDPQLDQAIEVVVDALVTHPPHTPDPSERPRLGTPILPPRP